MSCTAYPEVRQVYTSQSFHWYLINGFGLLNLTKKTRMRCNSSFRKCGRAIHLSPFVWVVFVELSRIFRVPGHFLTPQVSVFQPFYLVVFFFSPWNLFRYQPWNISFCNGVRAICSIQGKHFPCTICVGLGFSKAILLWTWLYSSLLMDIKRF